MCVLREAGVVMAPLLVVIPAHAASRCDTSGDAELWACDACLWQYETDDTLHPGVLRCAGKNHALVSRAGSCKARRIFKDRICTLAR